MQSLWSDDGIALHFPDADAPPALADLLVEPGELEDLVVQEVGSTALFGARFRENAARALLIPRRRPGQRTPLWQQRLKAQSLLEVARKYGSFPIVLETYRECLQDVFDLPALRGILRGLATRELDLVEVETPSASPMAASLLFDYVATYMYEDDTPAAERRAQALSLDRELLRELLGQEELRDLLDAGALAEVEALAAPQPRNADELHDLLRRVGDLRDGRARRRLRRDARSRAARVPRPRRRRGRAVIAAEDAGLYRDALGVMPPGGLPEAFLEPVDDALERVLAGSRASRGPFTTREVAARYALDPDRVEELLAGARGPRPARPGRAPAGRRRARMVRPGRARRHPPRFARACSAARWSPQSRPRSAAFCRPGTGSTAARRCARRSSRSRALALPVSLWEARDPPAPRARLPAGGARPALRLRRGRVGRRGSRPGRRSTTAMTRRCSGRRGRRAARGPGARRAPRRARAQRRVLAGSRRGGGDGRPDALPVLWELVWNGEVTNDAWAPLRATRRYGVPAAERRPRRFSRSRGFGASRDGGALVAGGAALRGVGGGPRAPRARRAAARAPGHRHARRRTRRGDPGGYGAVYGELKALETVGACRRGYFVEGLGGAQFALPGAVERLRELRDAARRRAARPRRRGPRPAVRRRPALAAARGARAARVAGAHVVLLGGEAVLYVERGGRSLLPLRDPDAAWLRPAVEALVAWVRADRGRRLSVERFDGLPVVESEALPLLVEAGFLAGPRRAVLRPGTRAGAGMPWTDETGRSPRSAPFRSARRTVATGERLGHVRGSRGTAAQRRGAEPPCRPRSRTTSSRASSDTDADCVVGSGSSLCPRPGERASRAGRGRATAWRRLVCRRSRGERGVAGGRPSEGWPLGLLDPCAEVAAIPAGPPRRPPSTSSSTALAGRRAGPRRPRAARSPRASVCGGSFISRLLLDRSTMCRG